MYYNFNFLDELDSHNILFVFHNEKDDVETDIILPICNICASDLETKYTERKLNEKCVALQYPDKNSSDYIFNQFFDSPQCASMMHGSFKGCFVVDCSKYKNVNTLPIIKLFNYISENSSSDFKFIVLFNECKETDVINAEDAEIFKRVKIINLEISLSLLETYKEKVDLEIYNFLIEQYNNNSSFRRLSARKIEECVKLIIDNHNDKKNIVNSFINNINCERRIGF